MNNPILSEAARRGKGVCVSAALTDSYSDEEREFLTAMDRYKREYHRPNPTCCEVLAVVKSLGYEKAALCEHKWTRKQLGGDPAEASSTEWIEYCEKCGMENPGSFVE